MKNFSIKLHPIFVLIGCLLLYFKQGEVFLCYLIVSIIHEYAHFAVAKKLAVETGESQMTPFGGMIEMPLHKYPWQIELQVVVAGAGVNLFFAILLAGLWWFFPLTYGVTYTFAMANITTALVNFLPCFPLDGGRVAYMVAKNVLKIKKPEKMVSFLGIMFGTVFIVSFFFFPFNYTMLTLGIFMILGSAKKLQSEAVITCFYKTKNVPNEVCEEKVILCGENEEVYKIFKHYQKGAHHKIKVKRENGEQTVINQKQLYEKMVEYNGNMGKYMTFKDILK